MFITTEGRDSRGCLTKLSTGEDTEDKEVNVLPKHIMVSIGGQWIELAALGLPDQCPSTYTVCWLLLDGSSCPLLSWFTPCAVDLAIFPLVYIRTLGIWTNILTSGKLANRFRKSVSLLKIGWYIISTNYLTYPTDIWISILLLKLVSNMSEVTSYTDISWGSATHNSTHQFLYLKNEQM